MKMFGLKKSNERIMMPMQEQEGSKDCGPFSIAIMTSLAYEDDPSEIRYKQLATFNSYIVLQMESLFAFQKK